MLLNTLPFPGQPPTKNWPKTSIVSRLRNADWDNMLRCVPARTRQPRIGHGRLARCTRDPSPFPLPRRKCVLYLELVVLLLLRCIPLGIANRCHCSCLSCFGDLSFLWDICRDAHQCLPCRNWVCDAFFCFQVGFDPPPHMRVPTIPPNLAGIPGGKP